MSRLLRFGVDITLAGLLLALAEPYSFNAESTRSAQAALRVSPIMLHPRCKDDCQQINPAWAKAAKRLETNGWKTLLNRHGWSVRYPPSWEAETVDSDADNPEDAFQPILRGPKGCYELDQECGFIQLGSGWYPLTGPQRSMGPKKALLEKVNDSRFVLLQQGDAVLSGQAAYCIVYRIKLYEDYPNGVIFKEIETQYRDHFYFISISEVSKDRRMISAIASPDQWRLNATFETIASTFTFTAR